MRTLLSRLIFASLLLSLLAQASAAQAPGDAVTRLLPERAGDFRAQGAPRSVALTLEQVTPEDFQLVSQTGRDYATPDGRKFHVQIAQTRSTSAAYSLLRFLDAKERARATGLLGSLGVVGSAGGNRLRFIKGTSLVEIEAGEARAADSEALLEFARPFAESIEGVAGELPPLVVHLPDGERVNETSQYAVSLPVLQASAGRQPVLEAVSFEGGVEAATALYGAARLVVVEFTTPQYASDNDARIKQRIEQLRASGQPVPAAYRRIGNYSVFVFGTPDEAAATQLLEQVKYEKDVRWLGPNPHMLERAQEAYTHMAGNVILTSLKITGLSILLCLGAGGLFGGAIFFYRRAQQTATELYSDAGGMVRLNIDEITPDTDSTRLASGGDR